MDSAQMQALLSALLAGGADSDFTSPPKTNPKAKPTISLSKKYRGKIGDFIRKRAADQNPKMKPAVLERWIRILDGTEEEENPKGSLYELPTKWYVFSSRLMLMSLIDGNDSSRPSL
jgi:hypothetical protein